MPGRSVYVFEGGWVASGWVREGGTGHPMCRSPFRESTDRGHSAIPRGGIVCVREGHSPMTMMDVQQRYRGSLHIQPGGRGLPTTLEITNSEIIIRITHGETFTYSLDDVTARPHDTSMALLDITGDDTLYFRADDPFTFETKAIPALRSRSGSARAVQKERRWRLPVIGVKPAHGTGPAPTNAKRSRRSDRKSRPECDHAWRSLRIPGGIVRNVCEECGTVRLDLTEP